MPSATRRKLAAIGCGTLLMVGSAVWYVRHPLLFYLGGFLITSGHHLQELAGPGDSGLSVKHSPEELEQQVLHQNTLSSWAHTVHRRIFGLAEPHGPMLLIMCSDSRLEPHRIVGDSRDGVFYLISLPGPALTDKMFRHILFFLENKPEIKLVLIATHTDCAMRKYSESHANDPDDPFEELVSATLNHEQRVALLREHPRVRERIAVRSLAIARALVNTETNRIEISDH